MNNIHNVLLTKEFVEQTFFNLTGVQLHINNLNLYQKAFIHKSFLIIDKENDIDDETCALKLPEELVRSNERLEFLGDSVLNLIVGEYLYDTFQDKDEGFLTKLRTKIVRSDKLSEFAEKLGFRKFLLISSHLERITTANQGRNNPRLMEDVFEGFLGALYKDQGLYSNGFNCARLFIRSVMKKYINLKTLICVNDNFKDSLLRYYQTQGWVHPVYHLIKNENNKCFTVAVSLDKQHLPENEVQYFEDINTNVISQIDEKEICDDLNRKNILLIAVEKGKTKKMAEQACSKKAMITLGVALNY